MSPTMSPHRQRVRAQTNLEILDCAREQVAETGELVMRELGRQMGMTAPALYRYYPAIGALEEVLAREIALAAVLDIDAGGWDAYVDWAADNPMLFKFLARHPERLAELHAAVAGALAGAA